MELPASTSRPLRATRGAMAAAAAAKAEASFGGFGRELSLNLLQGQKPAAPLGGGKKGATAATATAGAITKGTCSSVRVRHMRS